MHIRSTISDHVNGVLFKSCFALLLLRLQMWADSDRRLSERASCSRRRSGSGNGRDFRAKHTEQRTGAAGFFLCLHQRRWNRQDCVRRQGTHHSANHSIRQQFKVSTQSLLSRPSQFCPGRSNFVHVASKEVFIGSSTCYCKSAIDVQQASKQFATMKS